MWEISSYNQVITFLLSCVLGGIFCFIYDIIRALRRVCLNSFFAITVGDILLWIFYAFVTFIFLMTRTNGEIRGYALFGEFLGFLVVRISVSKVVFSVLSFVFIKISSVNRKIVDCFYEKFEIISFKIIEYTFKTFKSVKKLLKNVYRLLYTNKNNLNAEKIRNETKTKA